MLQEIVVVEGKDDVEAVKRAIPCECVITHGYGFDDTLLDQLEVLEQRRGIIVLTDPDYAGKCIRSRIRERIPTAKHAYLPQKDAWKGDDIGVENAKPEAIRKALLQARATLGDSIHIFEKQDLLAWGLDGCTGAKQKRVGLCDSLGIGYGNAKQLLHRLNAFGITREEVEAALKEEEHHERQ